MVLGFEWSNINQDTWCVIRVLSPEWCRKGNPTEKIPRLHVYNLQEKEIQFSPLQWLHNEPDGVPNHRRLDCLFNPLFRRRSKKTSKLRVTGLCEGNSPVTGEFPSQRASKAENVFSWWRHHVITDAHGLFGLCFAVIIPSLSFGVLWLLWYI